MTAGSLAARAVILSLLHSTLAIGDVPSPPGPVGNRERIEMFGAGAELKVKREDGTGVRGVVETIGPESFVLVPKESGPPQEIPFDDVRSVNYPQRGYKAEGVPDPAAARRMVVQLGVGKHIMVRVAPKQVVRGHIRAIRENHFVVQPDGQAALLDVPYTSVHHVHKNLSFGATIVVVLAIAATAALILVLTGNEEIDVLPQ